MKDSDGKVPPEQLTAYERWELPVMGEKARKQPELKPPTAAELEEIRQNAYQEGFREGREAGHREGKAQGHQEGLKTGQAEGKTAGFQQGKAEALRQTKAQIQTSLQNLEKIREELQFPLKEVNESTEEAIVNLVLAISRAVIFRDLSLDQQQIENVVNEALAALPMQDEQAIVYVHPSNVAFLKEHLPAGDDFHYAVDKNILPGGCRIETRHTLLDYTVEKRFQTVVQKMLARHGNLQDQQDSQDFTEQMGEMSDLHRDLLESGHDSEEEPADDKKPEVSASPEATPLSVTASRKPAAALQKPPLTPAKADSLPGEAKSTSTDIQEPPANELTD